jgi:hypothetical protein
MEKFEFGRIIVEIEDCLIGAIDYSKQDQDDIEVTLIGGNGFHAIGEVTRIPFQNVSMTLYAGVGHREYDQVTSETLTEWFIRETPLILSCREKSTILWNPETTMAMILPAVDVQMDWDNFWRGAPMMN